MDYFRQLFLTPITYVEIALLLFVSVFIGMLVREGVRSKSDAQRMAGMPLEDGVEHASEAAK